MSALRQPTGAPLWTAQQQAWLGALGHVLYVPGEVPVEARERVVERATERPGAVPARPSARSAPSDSMGSADSAGSPRRSRLPDPPRQPTPSHSAPAASALPARRASRMPDKLHFALIRASGCNPNAPGAAELFAQWPSSSKLRGDPAAKRALWPALRTLRRREAGPK